jgi:hypothetical protein
VSLTGETAVTTILWTAQDSPAVCGSLLSTSGWQPVGLGGSAVSIHSQPLDKACDRRGCPRLDNSRLL